MTEVFAVCNDTSRYGDQDDYAMTCIGITDSIQGARKLILDYYKEEGKWCEWESVEDMLDGNRFVIIPFNMNELTSKQFAWDYRSLVEVTKEWLEEIECT